MSLSFFLRPSPPSSSRPSSISVHTLTFFFFLSSVLTSLGGQQWSAAHLQPRGGGRSHASGRTRWCRFPPPISLPQPPHPSPHGDRLHGDSLHTRHRTGQRPEGHLLPISDLRRQQPHEPDLVPRGVRFPMFKSDQRAKRKEEKKTRRRSGQERRSQRYEKLQGESKKKKKEEEEEEQEEILECVSLVHHVYARLHQLCVHYVSVAAQTDGADVQHARCKLEDFTEI
ncbi:hypothetical protein D9C73_022486 [Collichthys lucidus]|uniref:Uncharacterized protein n=1 Tax=Collichthys lucidus TaxID=240159 RepID=A0A4U5VKY4_COLLU|nr:hypothetical protein D9C73_022486 [Collichthys lucidus]